MFFVILYGYRNRYKKYRQEMEEICIAGKPVIIMADVHIL